MKYQAVYLFQRHRKSCGFAAGSGALKKKSCLAVKSLKKPGRMSSWVDVGAKMLLNEGFKKLKERVEERLKE